MISPLPFACKSGEGRALPPNILSFLFLLSSQRLIQEDHSSKEEQRKGGKKRVGGPWGRFDALVSPPPPPFLETVKPAGEGWGGKRGRWLCGFLACTHLLSRRQEEGEEESIYQG